MLALALILDAILGEPESVWRRLPHPAILLGRLVEWFEARLNTGDFRRLKGFAAVIGLCVAVWVPASFLSLDIFGGVFEVAGAATLLAQKSLVQHVRRVAEGLRISLEAGRHEVSQIVGRDPETLDRSDVARAAIESAAENFSDGVVAPAFWFALLGLPGIALYKAVNTADSMIGHLSLRYREFGWAAARLDDALNWIPARLAGALLCLVGGGRVAFDVMRREASFHRSPNAGWPEAAMAASLGIALAGPRSYGGVPTKDAWINMHGRQDAHPDDIDDAIGLVWKAWGALLALAVLWWGIGAVLD